MVDLAIRDAEGWSALERPELHLLVQARSHVADRVAAALDAHRGDDVVDVTLDVLVEEGLRATPDFALVTPDGRAVVRGAGRAIFVLADGSVRTLEAAPRMPWRDEDAPDGTIRVELAGPSVAGTVEGPPAESPSGADELPHYDFLFAPTVRDETPDAPSAPAGPGPERPAPAGPVPETPTSAPRWHLRVSAGEEVELDRMVVIGRAPRPGQGDELAEEPRLVRVPSPDNEISRSHVAVWLDGDVPVVRDLTSTNGTTITMPHGPTVRLAPGARTMVEPGTVVTLADAVDLVVDRDG